MRLLLILLLVGAPALAQTGRAPFEVRLAASVFGQAFAFIATRALEPVTVQDLAVWGLNSVAGLDPSLSVRVDAGAIRLLQGGRDIYQRGVPPPQGDPDGSAASERAGLLWGPAVADVLSAAWDASDAVRRAGTAGVVAAVMDEVVTHLDPYSRYVAPGAADLDRDKRLGDAGAGLRLSRQGRAIMVLSVNQAGPAADAGIVAGDRLMAVDDQPVEGEDLASVLAMIAGPEGTDVSLTVRSRNGTVRTVEAERAVVPPETVFADRRGDLLLIRIAGFSADTDQRLRQELIRWLGGRDGSQLRGVVIDLRGNRGGLLRQAVSTTDLLQGPGLIATTAGRNPAARHDFVSQETDRSEGLPMAVLVDGRSASAAEIMAAALADSGRAVVIGSGTLGKGLVQTVANLPDGGEIFVTWSRVLAPRGWPIQGLGVMPQVCTSAGPDSLAQQLASLARGSSRMASAIARHRAARAPLPPAEILSLRENCPAADGPDGGRDIARDAGRDVGRDGGRDLDLATARTVLANARAYQAALLQPR